MIRARRPWRPSKRQVELLVDCLTARLGTAEPAQQLGVSEPEFVAWAARDQVDHLIGAGLVDKEQLRVTLAPAA